jgi:hypothetical protein
VCVWIHTLVCKCFKGTFREDSITKKMWGCFFMVEKIIFEMHKLQI